MWASVNKGRSHFFRGMFLYIKFIEVGLKDLYFGFGLLHDTFNTQRKLPMSVEVIEPAIEFKKKIGRWAQ